MKRSWIFQKDSQQYFAVSAVALLSFAQNKTSVLAICSYLILSRYSLKSSYSTAASANIICKRLNIRTSKAKQAISELLNCRFKEKHPLLSECKSYCDISSICDSLEEQEIFSKEMDLEYKRKVSSPKYDLIKSNRNILISNSLIDSHCDKLKHLIRNNDHRACLMLLNMHLHYDYNLDSVKSDVCSIQCHNIQFICEENGIAFSNGALDTTPNVSENICKLAFGQNDFEQYDVTRLFSTLEHAGLMKRVVCVFMRPRRSNSKQHFYYELDIKTNDPSEKLSCHNLAYRMRKFVQDRGYAVGRKDNRFYNEYVFAAPSDKEIAMVVLYRLPFAMRNIKNLDVQKGVKFRQQNHEQVCKWVDIAEYNGIS